MNAVYGAAQVRRSRLRPMGFDRASISLIEAISEAAAILTPTRLMFIAQIHWARSSVLKSDTWADWLVNCHSPERHLSKTIQRCQLTDGTQFEALSNAGDVLKSKSNSRCSLASRANAIVQPRSAAND